LRAKISAKMAAHPSFRKLLRTRAPEIVAAFTPKNLMAKKTRSGLLQYENVCGI
jgi:hypothetical protein